MLLRVTFTSVMECKLKQIASFCKLNTIYISMKVYLKKGKRAYVLVICAFLYYVGIQVKQTYLGK